MRCTSVLPVHPLQTDLSSLPGQLLIDFSTIGYLLFTVRVQLGPEFLLMGDINGLLATFILIMMTELLLMEK